MMRNHERLKFGMLILASLAVLGAAELATIEENLLRLREFSLDRRHALVENLQQFDGLPRLERERLRELDRQLAEFEPEVRERYYGALRRYASWFGRLGSEMQERLMALPPEQRMSLVRELLLQQSREGGDRLDRLIARYSNLHTISLLDQAYLIRSWFALSPEQKAQVQASASDQRTERLALLGRENSLPDDRSAVIKKLQPEVDERLRLLSTERSALESMSPQAREALTRQLIEALFIEDLDPVPVSSVNLDRFATNLPDWMLRPLDTLPPEPARVRLEILYRLVFPAPSELPVVGSGTTSAPETPRPSETPEQDPRGTPSTATPF